MLSQRLKCFLSSGHLYARTFCSTAFCSTASQASAKLQKNEYNSAVLLDKVETNHGENMLYLHWKNNTVSRFPYIYLRDLCNCSKCVNQQSLERLSDTVKDVTLDIQAKNVHVSQQGDSIQIEWPDHHASEFKTNWLHDKRLLEKHERDEKLANSNLARKGVQFWNRSDLQDRIPRFDFHKIMKEDVSLYEWLEKLHSIGIALLEGVPAYTDKPAGVKIAKRVGYLKSTHYGDIFQVYAKFDANNLAYTAGALPLHTDLPQCEHYPGAQFLNCIEQAPIEGGANMFVDGFHIAQQFKEMEPELFKLLSVTPIPFWDIGKDDYGDFHLKTSQPLFELDHDQNITRCAFNNHIRDYFFRYTPERVLDIYRGYIKIGSMMRDPLNRIDYKLVPGEMVTFNNSRVLHGRTAYTPTATGGRHLQGNYLDWDLMYGRLRSLGSSLGRPFEE